MSAVDFLQQFADIIFFDETCRKVLCSLFIQEKTFILVFLIFFLSKKHFPYLSLAFNISLISCNLSFTYFVFLTVYICVFFLHFILPFNISQIF
jgi:hypothetical protein